MAGDWDKQLERRADGEVEGFIGDDENLEAPKEDKVDEPTPASTDEPLYAPTGDRQDGDVEDDEHIAPGQE